jgi:hypothetical protein
MIRKQRFTIGLAVVAVALMAAFCSDGTSVDGSCPRVYKAGGFEPLNFALAFTTILIACMSAIGLCLFRNHKCLLLRSCGEPGCRKFRSALKRFPTLSLFFLDTH